MTRAGTEPRVGKLRIRRVRLLHLVQVTRRHTVGSRQRPETLVLERGVHEHRGKDLLVAFDLVFPVVLRDDGVGQTGKRRGYHRVPGDVRHVFLVAEPVVVRGVQVNLRGSALVRYHGVVGHDEGR